MTIGVAGFNSSEPKSAAQTKVAFMERFAPTIELLRSIIDHKKVFVLALNGPSVGAGAAWFQGSSDIVLAAEDSWIQVTFSAMGLVPENGSAINFAQSMGVHRANDILMFGHKCSAQELEKWGLVNQIFPTKGFHDSVVKYLEKQLEINDGKSMIETKRLMNAPRRSERMLSVYDSMEALAERFVEGAPAKRFNDMKASLEGKSKTSRNKLKAVLIQGVAKSKGRSKL